MIGKGFQELFLKTFSKGTYLLKGTISQAAQVYAFWIKKVGLVGQVSLFIVSLVLVININESLNKIPETLEELKRQIEQISKNEEDEEDPVNNVLGRRKKLEEQTTLTGPTATPTPGTSKSKASDPTATPSPTPTVQSYPTTPPAEICGDSSILDGPATAPANAIQIDPSVTGDLITKNNANPAGSTFWLAPGTHTLGNGAFDKVETKNGNSYIGAPGAILDGQGLNRYAFTQQSTNVTIKHLTIKNFVPPHNEGAVNHNSGNGWTIQHNTIKDNSGAALMSGANQTVSYNCLTNNGQYGMNAFQAGDGITNIVIDHNEISYNNTDDWETTNPGCGCTGGLHFWAVDGATITNNWIHHNYSIGIFADTNNVGFEISGNYINDNDWEAIVYETSYNVFIHHNNIIQNAIPKGQDKEASGDNFPIGAVYISESGGYSSLNSGVYGTLKFENNRLKDNWGGLVLWENADRFCASPSNSSTGYCTLISPATLSSCDDPAGGGQINVEPYYSACRWKTQNILIQNNEFFFNKKASVLGNCNTTYCGHMAVLSNAGSSPSWSPYMGDVIQTAITFDQSNTWKNNTYDGNWLFVPFSTANLFSHTVWQAAPYNQDNGSDFTFPVFTGPDDISGLQFWFKADAISLNDNDLVGLWEDQSGNGRNLTASAGDRPVYKTNIFNSKPVVRFDGTDILTTSQLTTSLSQPNTVCVVASSTDPTGGIKDFFSGSVVTYSHIIGSNNNMWFSYAGAFLNDGTADTDGHIFCTIFDGVDSKKYVDGGSATTGDPGAFALDGVTLGASGAGDQKVSGDIAEVAVYSNALSTIDLNSLGNHLATKYGLSWTNIP